MNQYLIFLLQAFVVLNVLSFAWSVIGVFKKHSEMQYKYYRVLQFFSILQWLVMIKAVFFVHFDSDFKIWIALIIQLICAVIFWTHSKIVKENGFTIVFSMDKPQRFVQKGLYKYIRHPFYSTYMLSYFSLSFIYLDLIGIISSFTILFLYYKGSLMEEEKFLNSDFSIEYSKYIKRSGRFFPGF